MGFAILTFLTVTMSIVVGHQLINSFLSRDSERVRERMANEFGQAAGTSAVSPLYKNLDQLSLESAVATNLDGAAPPKPAPRLGLMAQISAWLGRSDLSWGPFHLFAWMTCLAGIAGSIAGWFGGHVAGVSAALAAALAPMIYVHIAIGARRERYLKQLPNAFELMARIIRAGQSVPQALQAVAEAFDNPLAGEFKACLQKQNLGMRPETAFQAMAEASGIVEVRIFSMAMMIQRQTGGNLSDVLERLAGLVRARLKLRQQVRTLTAEGRLQGGTLVVLPFVVFIALLFVNRSYVEVLFEHVSLIVATLASMGIGVLWIRKIVNIDS